MSTTIITMIRLIITAALIYLLGKSVSYNSKNKSFIREKGDL